MVRLMDNDCKVVDALEGERIEGVMIYHSDGAIRNLQSKLSYGASHPIDIFSFINASLINHLT